MCTLTYLPFATHFCFEHFCFTSHLHQLTASHGINLYLFYFAVFILYGLKPGAYTNTKRSNIFSLLDKILFLLYPAHRSTRLLAPHSSRKTFATHSFSVLEPQLWNNLPRHLHKIDNYGTFKKELKTHLFKVVFLGQQPSK